MIEGFGDLVRLVDTSSRVVVFTGAGVSTESGIPDFRSRDGVWSRFDPTELTYQSFMTSAEARRRYWDLGRLLFPLILAAEPGPAHHATTALWRLGRLDCCITQNVDGLHQRAGLPSDCVVELHGNATRARCLDCASAFAREAVHAWPEFLAGDIPQCPQCRGTIKPTTILFGETIPRAALAEAERRARAADVFLVIGTSLAVYPAAYPPRHARQAGARLAIVNFTPTPLDHDAAVVVRGAAGDVMTALVQEVSARV